MNSSPTKFSRLFDSLAEQFPRSPFAAWKEATSTGARPDLPPDAAYKSLPRALRRQLHRVAERTLLAQYLRGLCWLIAVFSLLLPLQALWDWVATLPLTTRALLLLGDSLIVAGIVWWFGWRPLKARPGLEACALRVERHWSDFRSSLISLVQFSLRDPTPCSTQLAKNISAQIGSRRLEEAVSLEPLRRPALVAAFLAFLTLLLFAFTWPVSPALLARIALQEVAIPTKTRIVSITGDLYFSPGEALTIEARVAGEIPLSGRLEISAPGRPLVILPLASTPAASDAFAATLQNAQESFRYRVILNDARSAQFSAQSVSPPTLASVEFTQIYPAYTRLEPVPRPAGNLELLAGSRLEIKGSSTQPLRAARLEIPNRPPLSLATQGTSFSGELPIPAAEMEGFSIVLENEQGLPSTKNTLYRVQIVPDLPPQFAWDPDSVDRRTLTSSTKPSLHFTARDDFRIIAFELVATPNGEEDKTVRVPLRLAAPISEIEYQDTLAELEKTLPWKAGSVITYWIEARDNNDVTGPGITRSPVREWLVVTPEDKRREIQERLDRNAKALQELATQQETLSNEVGTFLKKP